MWAWLSLVFFIKGFGLRERAGLKYLVERFTDAEVNQFVDETTLSNIKHLSELKIENEEPPRDQDPFTEAENLEKALANNDKKEILLAALLVLYVIRCNLFHGDKSWANKRDNEVIWVAKELLLSIIGKLVVMA